MKKYVLSAAFVSLLGLAAQAQDQQRARNSAADETTNKAALAPADQKIEKVEAVELQPQKTQNGAQQQDPTKAKPATRMAITEKGVPASKNTEAKPAEQKASEQKTTNPSKSPKH